MFVVLITERKCEWEIKLEKEKGERKENCKANHTQLLKDNKMKSKCYERDYRN